jgi:hypothetical protein
VRLAIVAVILAWLAFEFYMGAETLWMAIGFGMLIYAVYTFFITWPKDDGKTRG